MPRKYYKNRELTFLDIRIYLCISYCCIWSDFAAFTPSYNQQKTHCRHSRTSRRLAHKESHKKHKIANLSTHKIKHIIQTIRHIYITKMNRNIKDMIYNRQFATMNRSHDLPRQIGIAAISVRFRMLPSDERCVMIWNASFGPTVGRICSSRSVPLLNRPSTKSARVLVGLRASVICWTNASIAVVFLLAVGWLLGRRRFGSGTAGVSSRVLNRRMEMRALRRSVVGTAAAVVLRRLRPMAAGGRNEGNAVTLSSSLASS